MAKVELKNYPKELDDELENLALDLRINKKILLSAIVLFAISNQNTIDATPKRSIDIQKDVMIESIKFPIGKKTEKNKIKQWGKKFGRNEYDLQVLYIVARFVEHQLELPREYLEEAADLRD